MLFTDCPINPIFLSFRLTQLTQVTLACDHSITVWAVELCHILCVLLQNMHLHGAALCETSMADVALVWLLTCNTDKESGTQVL